MTVYLRSIKNLLTASESSLPGMVWLVSRICIETSVKTCHRSVKPSAVSASQNIIATASTEVVAIPLMGFPKSQALGKCTNSKTVSKHSPTLEYGTLS